MTTTLTRDKLYTLVWSEPIQHLAKRYNISDRGLGKLCARHSIPVPPRGWWAKKAAGHRMRQPPLSPLAPGRSATIVIEGQAKMSTEQQLTERKPLAAEIAFERDPLNVIVVDENARPTHPLVRDASAELRSQPADRDGIVRTPRGCVDVRVSKGSAPRALRILQALFRGLEMRGYSVAIKDGKTWVTVLGESYRVFLKERLRRTIRELTPDEHKRRREGSEVYPYQLVPTGELSLHLAHSWPSRAIADRKKARLEDSLNEFIEILVERAYGDKAARARREEEARRRREAEAREREDERRTRAEEAKRDHFDGLAQHWKRNQERREFLADLRRTLGDVDSESELGQWLAWAEHYIERMDVLRRFRNFDETLTLYYSGYSSDIVRIRREGFRDPEPASDRSQRRLVGVTLREQKPKSDWSSESFEVQLPMRAVLPFEVTEPGYVPRVFRVPAAVVNRVLGVEVSASGAADSYDDVDDDL